jgi:hypothetical protein
MGHPSPDQTFKKQYGGVKSALLYCVEMNMNKSQAAAFLGIARKTLRERASLFNVKFPDGYATRDDRLMREVNSKRTRERNLAREFGRGKR